MQCNEKIKTIRIKNRKEKRHSKHAADSNECFLINVF
jgi:hypothetical protein